MKLSRTDIPFSGDDAHAFLPWVVGIMACLATLMLCLAISVGGWILDRGGSYTNSFTVNISATSDGVGDKLPAIENVLKDMDGVLIIKRESEDALRDLLRPWLGNSEALDALPLPVVYEVKVENAEAVDHPALQKKLDAILPGIEVDTHERWVESFSHFSSAVRTLMSILSALVISSLGLMIAFMCRASLKLHARTVNLLHSIGAADRYIMRQFQYEAMLVTLRGTIPGCLLAGLAYWGAGSYMATLQSALLPPFSMQGGHFLLMVLMPLACGGVAWLAARISVIKQLQRVL
jgi:cell division transport system permease protein